MLATNQKKPYDPSSARPPSDRRASGHSKPGVAPTTFFRIREHGVRLGLDPRLSTVLGRMGLFKELSEVEVDCGFKIAEIYGRYESLKGIPRRSAASPSYQAGFGAKGVDTGRMLPDELKRYERKVRRATKAFDRLQAMIPHDYARELLERVCCDNQDPGVMHKRDVQFLLHKVAEKMGLVAPAKARPERSERPDDGAVLATATVDALLHWFDTNTASKPTHFSLVENRDWKRVRGITGSDGRFHHTIPVPLRHLSVKALDAQLRLACAVKGLLEIRDAETGEVT